MDRSRRLLPMLGRALTDAVPTALLILVVNFFLLRLAPGDAAEVMAGEVMAGESGSATEETLAALRSRFGLDLPVLTVGGQIAEVLRRHEGLSACAARSRAIELLDRVRIPIRTGGSIPIRTSSPAACASG